MHLASILALGKSIASMANSTVEWDRYSYEQKPVITGRPGTKKHQRTMSKRKAQRRAKRQGHY